MPRTALFSPGVLALLPQLLLLGHILLGLVQIKKVPQKINKQMEVVYIVIYYKITYIFIYGHTHTRRFLAAEAVNGAYFSAAGVSLRGRRRAGLTQTSSGHRN